MKAILSASVLLAFAGLASADVLDDLLPVPVRVERLQGNVAVRPDGGAACVRGEIAGCPRETADEAYVLEVGSGGVRIVAPTERGERWAKVTLKQLVKLSGGQVPCCRITDWPRYRFRGFMIDVARNFLEMDELKALIDVMGDYKLNAFHWHLTENYCWRLESKRHPELQGPNGWYDPHKVRHSGRFYTQEEFKVLVEYAWARGVTVIPEFDLPGHSAAFRQAFGLKGMDDPRALEISLDLYDELCELVPAEKMPVIHMGMDEVWDQAEQPSKGMYSAWTKKLNERGRIAANWGGSGPLVIEGATRRMLFGFGDGIAGVYYEGEKRDAKVANGVEAFVDPKWYIEEDDPFELLCRAAYTAPFSTAAGRKLPDGLKAGAEFCAWHDSAVGLPTANAFRNQQIFPSCVLYGDLFWRGREKDYPEFERRLPLADDPRLDIAKDLERRAIAHRDRIFADFKYPFCFLKQTDMRWRLSHADGRLIAKDIAQATVFPFRKKDKPLNYVDEDHGDVVMETWIRSPKDQEIGAWIGFTAYDRDHGRGRAHGTPSQGQWNNVGATVEVNGERIPPPKWENPDIPDGGAVWVPLIKYQYPSDEIPFRNEEYYMREPTKVRLRAGWNHVKLHLPMPHAVNWVWRRQWVGTFIPVAGTTDHPREVEGLVYSSDDPRCDATAAVPDRWIFERTKLEDAAETQGLVDYVNRAADVGCNGLALIVGEDYMHRLTTRAPEGTKSELCGWEECESWSAAKWRNYRTLKAACDRRGMDLIPLVWSVGYASMAHHDPTLASVQPVDEVPYVARDGRLEFAGEPPLALPVPADGEMRADFRLPVRPHAVYRFCVEFRTEGIRHAEESLWCRFKDTKSGASRSWMRPNASRPGAPVTSDWQPLVYDVHTGDGDLLDCFLGLRNGETTGKVWYRNLSVRRIGFQTPLVRAGAPFVVKDAATGRVYEPGRDYVVPAPPDVLLYHGQPMRTFELVKGGAIAEGSKVLVSGYEPVCEWAQQLSACLRNPALGDYFARTADIVQRNFAPKRWFLSTDEYRCGCRCEFCRRTDKTVGRQLSETVARMHREIRRVSPSAEIFMWPDMFDPDVNARDGYYQLPTTAAGSWEGLPRDIVMAVWGTYPREASFRFFEKLGHRTLVATYYDEDEALAGSRSMLSAASRVSGVTGWMYTPWEHSRDLVERFAAVAKSYELQRSGRNDAPLCAR